jgi:hypothetical protein
LMQRRANDVRCELTIAGQHSPIVRTPEQPVPKRHPSYPNHVAPALPDGSAQRLTAFRGLILVKD